MKSILCSVLLLSLSCAVFAQSNKLRGYVNIGAEGGLPVGSVTANQYKSAYGGSIAGEIPTSQTLFITLSAGYIHLNGKHSYYNSGVNAIPLKVGVKTYVDENVFI